MAKANGTIDLKAYKNTHDDAEKKATNYLVDADNSGLTIHPVGVTANRVLIDGNGMNIYKDNNSVAFYGDISRIGKQDNSHIEMDYHSLKLIDRDGDTYFHVSDLRDEQGIYRIRETFTSDGSTRQYNLTMAAKTNDYTVYVDDVEQDSTSVTKTTLFFAFNVAPSEGSSISVSYEVGAAAKAFTLGERQGATGAFSYAFGRHVTASAPYTVAEGFNSIASRTYSHAEGQNTTASGQASHSEGYYSTASGSVSHAEGSNTTASGLRSHAQNEETIASGAYSHAEGYHTTASGQASHAGGYRTTANGNYQTVIGVCNVPDTTSLVIVGNGASNAPRNAFSMDKQGEMFSVRSGNVLLSDIESYMLDSQQYTFSQKVSDQLTGIVLVWSAYVNGATQDYDWYYQFVPKWHVLNHPGKSIDCIMMNNSIASDVVCKKCVYITDTTIKGNDNNSASGTGYANNSKVLRAVIGV